MNRLCSKLRDTRGASLTEMLVAVVILGLVTLAVSVGITSALPVYHDSVALSESSVLASTLSQALWDELRYARDVETDGAGNVTAFTSATFGPRAAIGNEDGQITVSGKPLIGSGAYTNFSATASVTRDADDPALLTILLRIQETADSPVWSTEFQVRLLNGYA